MRVLFIWTDICGIISVKALDSIIIVDQVGYFRVQKLGWNQIAKRAIPLTAVRNIALTCPAQPSQSNRSKSVVGPKGEKLLLTCSQPSMFVAWQYRRQRAKRAETIGRDSLGVPRINDNEKYYCIH
jgi:hypothetical protein